MKKGKIIHCSFDTVEKFVPRIPKHRCVGENATIPRICAGPSVRKCLAGIPQSGAVMYWMQRYGLPIIVHAYYLKCRHVEFDVSEYVGDARYTGEMWLLETPSEVHRIDYEVLVEDFTWVSDPYGYAQRHPIGVKLMRTMFQDNFENLLKNAFDKKENENNFREKMRKHTFRDIMTCIAEIREIEEKCTMIKVKK